MNTKKKSQPLILQKVCAYSGHSTNKMEPRFGPVSFKVYPGEWINLVGTNGSGKSSLGYFLAGISFMHLTGIRKPGFTTEITNKVAPIVLQNPDAQLFGETVREEIEFALECRGITRNEGVYCTEKALKQVGLTEVADLAWTELSGGQRQLAAFAAATAGFSPLLILDEVTAMLDEQHRPLILRLTKQLHQQGTTIIWITQQLEECAPTERVIALKKGEIIFDGNTRAFFFGKQTQDPAQTAVYLSPLNSPAVQCGLRLPYLSVLALELRQLGKLTDPLPVTETEWIKIWDKVNPRIFPVFEKNGRIEQKKRPLKEQETIKGLLVQGFKCSSKRKNPGLNLHTQAHETELYFPPGSITLIIGPNGSGKSTLLEKMAGLSSPESLNISFSSEPLWGLSAFFKKKQLNTKALRCYSYTSQMPEEGLFARSVEEELDYSLRPYGLSEQKKQTAITNVLQKIGWSKKWLFKDPFRMSGGEKRKTALASGLVTSAPWLLIDEPTVGLDGTSHLMLAQQLKKERDRGRGVVMVSHDWDWALPLADRIVWMEKPDQVCVFERDVFLSLLLNKKTAMFPLPFWLQIPKSLFSIHETKCMFDPVQAAKRWPNRKSLLGLKKDKNAKGSSREKEIFSSCVLPNHSSLWEKPIVKVVSAVGFQRFDPSCLWVASLLLTISLWYLQTGPQLLLAGFVLFFVLQKGGICYDRWAKIWTGYLFFSILPTLIFTLSLTDGRIDFRAFSATFAIFFRTSLMLLVGFAVSMLISPLALRHSLEQLLFRANKRRSILSQKIILTITLLVRFIPVLAKVCLKFQKLSLSRGKDPSFALFSLARKLKEWSFPLLLALFRLGDEVAISLESRGVGMLVTSPAPERQKHFAGTEQAKLQPEKWDFYDKMLLLGTLLIMMGIIFDF